jgi:cytochrome P450
MPRPENCPISRLDPFALEFLQDPYPYYESLREAGPVVWIDKYNLVAMARYQQVRGALDDWETYCSSRGVGLTDFATEEPWRPPSIILEADPPLHTRARGVLGKVLSKPAFWCDPCSPPVSTPRYLD